MAPRRPGAGQTAVARSRWGRPADPGYGSVRAVAGVPHERTAPLGWTRPRVRVLDPGRGRTKTGHVDDGAGRAAVVRRGPAGGGVYRYAPGRGGKHGETLLERFSGTAQIDGYSGYNRLRRPDRPDGSLTLAACWAHARRGLKDVFASGSVDRQGRSRVARLYESGRRSGASRSSATRHGPLDGIGADRERLRGMARRAALARVAALATRREADLHRQPVERPAGVPASTADVEIERTVGASPAEA